MAGSKPRWDFFRESYANTFGRPGLACPICMGDLTSEDATREHFPPRSIGGTRMVPTCATCNQRWSKAEAGLARYSRRSVQNGEAIEGAAGTLKLGSTGIKVIRKVLAEDFVVLRYRPNQAAAEEALTAKLKQGLKADEVFSLGDDSGLKFKEDELERSFLKAGYLALFAIFGYGLVARTDFSSIREQLQAPDELVFDALVGPHTSNVSDPAIILQAVLEPAETRVLIVRFQSFILRPGDATKMDVVVHLPSPGVGAMDRYAEWCNTVASGSETPVTLITEQESFRADGCLGWYPQTELGQVEVFPPVKASELVMPTRNE